MLTFEDVAAGVFEDADGLARSAAEQVRHLRAQLDTATRAEAEATTAVRVALASRDHADRAARDAQQRLQHARARIEALQDQQAAPPHGGGS